MALSFMAFLGCGDDDDDDNNDSATGGGGNGDVTTAGSFSAKLDGKDWKADITVATYDGNILSVTGQAFPGGIQTGTSEQIGFVLQNVTGPGSHSLAIPNSARVILAQGSGAAITVVPYIIVTGDVKISDIDDKGAKGTFNFTASLAPGGASVTITDGTFDVKF
jgi:hypothetical protein